MKPSVALFELNKTQKSDLHTVSRGNGFKSKKAWLLHHIESDKLTMEGENQCQNSTKL